eukprot:5194667-Prymnesium_polylepis.2
MSRGASAVARRYSALPRRGWSRPGSGRSTNVGRPRARCPLPRGDGHWRVDPAAALKPVPAGEATGHQVSDGHAVAR